MIPGSRVHLDDKNMYIPVPPSVGRISGFLNGVENLLNSLGLSMYRKKVEIKKREDGVTTYPSVLLSILTPEMCSRAYAPASGMGEILMLVVGSDDGMALDVEVSLFGLVKMCAHMDCTLSEPEWDESFGRIFGRELPKFLTGDILVEAARRVTEELCATIPGGKFWNLSSGEEKRPSARKSRKKT